MAAATNYSNVLLLADTNTIAGPIWIKSIKLTAGSDTAALTLTSGLSGTPIIYKSSAVTSTSTFDSEVSIYVPSGDTITVALSGTSPKAFAYLGR